MTKHHLPNQDQQLVPLVGRLVILGVLLLILAILHVTNDGDTFEVTRFKDTPAPTYNPRAADSIEENEE